MRRGLRLSLPNRSHRGRDHGDRGCWIQFDKMATIPDMIPVIYGAFATSVLSHLFQGQNTRESLLWDGNLHKTRLAYT